MDAAPASPPGPTSSRPVILLVVLLVHALLSAVVILVSVVLSGLAVMVTANCGPEYLADTPACNGEIFGGGTLFLTLTSVTGPVVGLVALVLAVHERPWVGILVGGWVGSVVCFLIALAILSQ